MSTQASTTEINQSSRSPSILILGAGAIGAVYGALLAQSHTQAPSGTSRTSQPNSHDAATPQVSAVCRSNYNAVAKDGFRLTSPTYGSWTWRPHRTFPSPRAAADATASDSTTGWDYIVVCTKALPEQGDESALLQGLVRTDTGRRTRIVLVQNGLGVERSYATRFAGRAHVLSGVTVMSAAQPAPGVVQHNRWTRINVGPYFDGGGAEGVSEEMERDGLRAAEEFCGLLRAGGVKDASAYASRKLQLLRWHKCALNAAMNPSSVLSGGTANRTMANDEELGLHLLGVMREVLDTAEKVCGQSMPVEFASAEKILQSTRRNTSGSRPSMWADWTAGKALELEVILGAPIRLAREKGLEMPRLESMYALLKMAQKNRDAAREAGQARL